MSLLIYFWLYRNNHTTLQPKIARHFIKSIKVMFWQSWNCNNYSASLLALLPKCIVQYQSKAFWYVRNGKTKRCSEKITINNEKLLHCYTNLFNMKKLCVLNSAATMFLLHVATHSCTLLLPSVAGLFVFYPYFCARQLA